jgi:hypothetical protein
MRPGISPGRWSAEDILSHYRQLGVPHFQRGLVWGSDSVSLLLESLFLQTPCGALLLWRPLRPSKEGVALPGAQSPSHLILDGQQRIRSIRHALGKTVDACDDDDDGNRDRPGPRLWCLNLARVPELEADPELSQRLRDGARYPLFRLVRDPRDEDALFRYNLIPLEILLRGDNIPSSLLRADGLKPRLSQLLVSVDLAARVQRMTRDPLFDVHVVEETTDVFHLSHVVSIYNRINSGGRRVEAEEVAFSTLVSLAPDTGQWLREVFETLHPPSPLDGTQALSRDGVLRRRKERAFGFKLILRTFIQTCAYHFGHSLGSNPLSFDVVDSPAFRGDLVRFAARLKTLRDRTRDSLVFVRSVLEQELECDDLQMLPDTTALLPVLQLLIRFPDLRRDDHGSRIVAFLLLRLLLLPRFSQSLALALADSVNKSHTAADCIRTLVKELGDIRPRALRRELANSNSLQDRYVLLLYWLLRKNGALDLNYEQVKSDRRRAMLTQYGSKYERPVPLEESVQPEKQHLVPYTELRKLFAIRSRGRISRHPANNIGNHSCPN